LFIFVGNRHSVLFLSPLGGALSEYINHLHCLSGAVLAQLSTDMPLGSKLTPPGGHNFTLNYIRKTSNDFLYWTANENLTKLDRKKSRCGPLPKLFKRSDWLVTWSNNSFSKCNFQKSSRLKLHGQEISYLANNTI